jgi:tetratricopeptide (TPR) repeat protein
MRGVIGRRFDGLSDECNRVLTVASVIGREFDFDLLSRITDSSDDDLLDVVDEALEARVIEKATGGAERYQFTHALIQQTLSDELSPSCKVRLHARIGEALEVLYGDNVEAHADQLAYHFTQAETVIGTDKLVQYSVMAGEKDLETYAIEDALPHFQRALAVRENQIMDDELATLKFRVGRTMMPIVRYADEAQMAWDGLSQAFDYYLEQGDIEKAVTVATHPVPMAMITGSADLFAKALEVVPRGSLQAGYMLSRRAGALIYELADIEGGLNSAMEAIAVARSENDEVLEARSLANLIDPLRIDHRPQEAIALGIKAVELAQRIGDLQSEQRAQWVLAHTILTVGEPERARIHAHPAYQAAEQLHERVIQSSALLVSVYCAIYQGYWSKANELADQAREIMPLSELFLGLKIGISLQADGLGDTAQLIDNLSSDPVATIHVSARLLRAAYETNNSELLDMGEAALVAGKRSINAFQGFWIEHYAAIASALRNDTTTAPEHYSALAQDKGTVLYPALFSADHVLRPPRPKYG